MSQFKSFIKFGKNIFFKKKGIFPVLASIIGGYYAIHYDVLKKINFDSDHTISQISNDPEFIYLNMDSIHKDIQCRGIAQSSDLKDAISLARTPCADPSLFQQPPSLLLLKHHLESIEGHFRFIFGTLPSGGSNQCADYLTKSAQNYHQPMPGDQFIFPAIPENEDSLLEYYKRKKIPLSVVKSYLEALLSHSTIPSHRGLLVENGVLALLYKVQEKYKDDVIKGLIAQILGNISLDKHQHQALFASGWIGILSSWTNKINIEVSLPSVRALANMDQYENMTELYDHGLYILHPQFQEKDKKSEIDVIFIHGLMGSAFCTWRQNDTQKPNSSQANEKCSSDMTTCESSYRLSTEYTYCWPKDWLAKDFEKMRIIAVDYYSHASEWQSKCPWEKEKRSLEFRSKETLKKLLDAGIGRRPIVWVSHSMGGLLVKQMLLEAAKSDKALERAVVENTLGTVFYSVPHKGGNALDMSKGILFLLQPSMEAQEMKKGSIKLLKINDDFKNLMKSKKIAVMSFGETIPSKWGIGWKSLLVSLDSAYPDVGKFHHLYTDHLNTCKPISKSDKSYAELVIFLSNILAANSSKSPKDPVDDFVQDYLLFSMFK